MNTSDIMDDLTGLPAPQTIEDISFENILAELRADFERRAPECKGLLESDPATKLMQAFAYREVMLRQRENNQVRALLLAYATGADLDHIGLTYFQGTRRLTITPANPKATPPVAAVLETDKDYRRRLLLQPESLSVAGPRDAYRFHALTADGSVQDAGITRPEPGTTQVHLLTRSGQKATPELCAKVFAALSPDSIRPHCEEVIVSPARLADYALHIDIVALPGPSTETVRAAVQKACEDYAQVHYALGKDIILSAIDAAAHRPGVKKVTIKSPLADIVCAADTAPRCTAVNVNIAAIQP